MSLSYVTGSVRIPALAMANGPSCASPPEGNVSSEEPRPLTAGQGERVLVVEDESVLRQLTVRVLSRSGYEVLEAAGPLEALALSEAHPARIDLVLTDVMMPDMRGWELVDRLRATQPAAKVLYMSGFVDDGETGGSRVQPLLMKPFRPGELLEHVRRLLDAR